MKMHSKVENKSISTLISAEERTSKLKYLTITGVMAALIALMTAYICHIPVGMNGGYIHFGDSLIYLAAALLPRPYALAAAAIGGGIADLLTAPMWVPATMIIKMMITLPFTSYSKKFILPRNIIASAMAYLISGVGYFFAEYLLFGTWSVFFVSMLQSLVQSGGSALFFIIFGMALDKVHFKTRFMDQLRVWD